MFGMNNACSLQVSAGMCVGGGGGVVFCPHVYVCDFCVILDVIFIGFYSGPFLSFCHWVPSNFCFFVFAFVIG